MSELEDETGRSAQVLSRHRHHVLTCIFHMPLILGSLQVFCALIDGCF